MARIGANPGAKACQDVEAVTNESVDLGCLNWGQGWVGVAKHMIIMTRERGKQAELYPICDACGDERVKNGRLLVWEAG
jgi:hypothetical protein